MGSITDIEQKRREREMEAYPDMEDLVTLLGDLETGEGDIDWELFDELDPLMRADLLKDWLNEMNAKYQQAVDEAFGPDGCV